MVIAAIQQMLFSWGSVNDAELIERNRRGSALVQQYNDEIQACPPGVNPDIYRLISIESVRSRQNVQNISPLDIHNSILNSYTIDDSGYVHNKTPDEMMDSLNFSDDEKNWANLMYDTLNDQYLDPDGGFADKSPNYDGAMLGAEGETQVVYYSQLDSRWADKAYGKSGTIGGSGCGPTSLAAAFPFSSFEIYDPGGIFLGLNKYNSSVAILDIFDSDKYSNANGCILGMSGAGKTFLMQLMALRLRLQGTQVFILAPIKGHEFADACRAIGGKYIRIAPSSKDCINIMEIRKASISTDCEIKGDDRGDSVLAEKLQKLMIFFSLIKPDITQDELNLLDSAVIRTYKAFGIDFDNKSLFAAKGKFKKMPTLTDLYNELTSQPETKSLALMLEKFAVGSLSGFGGETNVDLDNKYIVLDISEMTEHLKPLGMFMALDYVWDKAKESRIRKKVIFLDELWTLIGAGSNRMAADYVLEIFKVIRGYGGAAIAATQDIGDFFSLDDGKYGKGVINNSRIKFILQLEEDEAFAVQKYMSLSDEETMQIKKLVYGKVLRKMH